MKSIIWILYACCIGLLPYTSRADAVIRLNNLDIKIPIVINNDPNVVIGSDYFVEILSDAIGGSLNPITIVGTNRTKIS